MTNKQKKLLKELVLVAIGNGNTVNPKPFIPTPSEYKELVDVINGLEKDIEKEKPKMNNPRYCGGKEQEEMEARGWRVMIKDRMDETAEEMFERLSKSYSKVKIYWDTTRVRGLHDYFAMVKR